jgi:hypothetical protein
METMTRFPEAQLAPLPGPVPTASAAPLKGLNVTATYLLSEEGRKASLLAGGDGHALQQIAVTVPVNRLHLVAVDRQGVARLKLRPRYEIDGEHRIVRVDSAPRYDAPPTVEDLFRAAARNHELASSFTAERAAARAERAESDRDWRERVAQAFLADPTQRAMRHPIPSKRSCCLKTERGRLTFDVAVDQGKAKDVPAEAHRRFRTDQRAARAQIIEGSARDVALHEEKKRYIAQWVLEHGTPEQQVRQAAGVLPMAEVIQVIEDEAFAAMHGQPLYERDGAAQLQAFLRGFPAYADAVVKKGDFVLFGTNAVKATSAQWALTKAVQAALPNAAVSLLEHRLRWKKDHNAPVLVMHRVLATLTVGPFTLRRDYSAPDS